MKRMKRTCHVLLCVLCCLSLLLSGCTRQTEEEPPEQTGPVYVLTYTVSGEGCGRIIGNTEQELRAGEPSQTVCAAPEPGYVFVRWSDGSTEDLRQGDIITEDTTLTAEFALDMKPLEMPMLSIYTENGKAVTSKEEYINATISISNTDEDNLLTEEAMQIRGRGNSSWKLQKKSYRLKLDNARNLLGQGKGPAKDWVLLANHSDLSLMRNYTVFYMAQRMSGLAYTTSAGFVELVVNDEYLGVYLLCEQVEVSPFRVDVEKGSSNADTGYLIELDCRSSSEYDEKCFLLEGLPYVVKSDIVNDAQLTFIRDYMIQVAEVINSGDQALIESYVDLDSMVDMYIVQEYFKNIDSGWASFYMYKDVGGKLKFGPVWDFDISAGNDYRLNEGDYKELYNSPDYVVVGDTHPNQMLVEMMKYGWFEQLVIARWREVAPVVEQTIEQIQKTVDANRQALLRNFERWQVLGTRQAVYHEPNSILILDTYEEQVEYLINWLNDRKDWLDQYFARRSIVLETIAAATAQPVVQSARKGY